MPKCGFNKAVEQSKATLLNSHFGMGDLLSICCIFSEHVFLRTPADDCFWFLLATCPNSSVDSFPYKYMSCLWSLIWSIRVWRGWHLTIWLETTVQSSTIESHFQNHPDLLVSQKYWLVSNQSFKHNLAHISFLNLTPKLWT